MIELFFANTLVSGAVTIVLLVVAYRFLAYAQYLMSAEAAIDRKLALADFRRRKYRTEITTLTFRALKSIAMADGVFHDSERRCLEASARQLAVKCPNLDTLRVISPAALSERRRDPNPRPCTAHAHRGA